MALPNPIKTLLLCLLLAALASAVAFAATEQVDFEVLAKFRKGLSNAELLKWPANGEDPCGPPSWNYIYCSGGRVAQIQTKNLGLVGTLPSDLNKLSMLSNIGLQGNNLTGPLPSFRGLSRLQYAYLGGNGFDTIPPDFFVGLDSLQVLSLDKNPLNETTGWNLPADLENSAQLMNLSLSGCNLAGPLPDFLSRMASLANLRLAYNRLTGEIPASYTGLRLQSLWLNNQQGPGLSGTLDVVASMTFLNEAWLHGNQFTGPIPPSIGALTSLTRLWLNNNRLVGVVPANLTNLPQLKSLHLDGNAFMGPIPKVGFEDFTYNSNAFCQSAPGVPCPPDVSALLDFLAGVNYPPKLASSWSGNDSCSGTWLGISCSGGKIVVINLPNFHLNGTISPSLGELDALKQILLGGNNLNGTIPESLAKLKQLQTLNLESNNISPPVPKFTASVKVILAGNPLVDGSPSGGPSSDNSPGSSGGGSSSSSSRSKTSIIIIAVVAVIVVIIVAAILLLLFLKKRKRSTLPQTSTIVLHPRDSSDPNNFVKIVVADKGNPAAVTELQSMNRSNEAEAHVIESGNVVISVQVLRAATGNFAPENVLGRGGFGVVYRGELHDGTVIAVKRTESGVVSDKFLDEFQAEISVLSKVRHRHLVSILGYSVDDNERLLVYEYMPQGALSKHLFQWRQFRTEPLSWKKRLNIALDVARGIEYLHNFANQCFIHRDLKSSNILLGDDFRAKISDFGLAKLAPDGNDSVATKLAGTFGYLAPEYAVTGKVTTKIDVFSFGVILMELVTGLKALDETRAEASRYLAHWFVQMKGDKEKLRSIVDPAVAVTDETFDCVCIIAELAGHCVARDPHQRPDMGHAVNVLAPLVEKWKPSSGEQEEYIGIDLCQPLLQMVKGWQAAEGSGDSVSVVSSMSIDDSKGSIPARPAGFAESFTSVDGR